MCSSIFTIMQETFLVLRRDRIFIPALIAGFFITVFANLASNWSIEDFSKILFDVGVFGFQMTGSFVAIFWGTKLIHDAKQDGSIEQQLAAPISRGSWLIGRFSGLALCLVTIAVIFTVLWQIFMLLNHFGPMNATQLTVFAFMFLGWLVLAAMAMFFASFCGSGVALFSSIGLWLAGLMTNLVYQNLPPSTGIPTKFVVNSLARVWDLQQFNLISEIYERDIMVRSELLYRFGYGLGLIAVILTISTIWFNKREVIS